MTKDIDVLFIYTNINGYHSDTYNFGIGYLSSILKDNGFSTSLVIAKSKNDYKTVLKTVLEHRPRVIGLSSVSSQFVFVSDIAKMIKKIYNCTIVCGGVHPTIFPDSLYSVPFFDGFFIGESEFPFLDFVTTVIKREDYKAIDNFCFINRGRLVKNKLRARIKNLEQLPFPDREIFNYQSIIDETDGVATIITNRGCPFNCTYCSNHAIANVYRQERNVTRYNSVEKVFAEIDMLRSKFKFNKLYFIDDLFILNKSWLSNFLAEYKNRFNIPFMCHVRPDVCTREIIFKLKDAGCYKVFLAIESANDYIRNVVMKRNISKIQLENAFMWAKEAGLETLSVNIIGVPGETEETIWETINFNRRMNPTISGTNIYSPYEGTELGDLCRQNGLIRDIDSRSFLDRRQTKLNLSTISSKKLNRFCDRFQYLVYKDIDNKKAKQALLKIWGRRYSRIEGILLFGFLLKKFRKVAKIIGKKILFNSTMQAS